MMHFQLSLRYLFRKTIRDNALCRRRVESLSRNEFADPAQLSALQETYLYRTLVASAKTIPAYTGLHMDRADLMGIFRELPIISKSDLIEKPEYYEPKFGILKPITPVGKTSGTTGTPLTVYRSLDSIIWENAFIHRHWSWCGFRPGLRRATLRGDNVAPARLTKGPFWFYNRWENQLLLSSRHLRAPAIDQIVEELHKFEPYILQAYPSTAYELASFLASRQERLEVPYIYTGSEMLYPHQRELIEKVFNARIMDFYGMAERVAFAAQCEQGNYHINPEYSYVEIVDDFGQPTKGEGFVVGTTFHNLTMPLVRYQLSDRTKWKPGRCPCGRTYPMIEPIAGKYEDVLYGSSGNAISPSIITFAFKGLQHIERSQVAQVGAGHWEIRVVPIAGYGEKERNALLNNVRNLIDPGLKVNVVECENIPRTDGWKYRWVVNEWDNRPGNAKSIQTPGYRCSAREPNDYNL